MQSTFTMISTVGAASRMQTMTTATMVMIGIGVVLALLVIWWGARKKSQRKAAERTLVDQGGVRETGAPIGSADETNAISAAPNVASPPLRPPTERDTPQAAAQPQPAEPLPIMATPSPEPAPAAPAPPPLAGDPTLLVAAAPLDANPAALAADLATAPEKGTDALTTMKGVGPKLAARLNELGITCFAQIAALTPDEADALDAQLGTFRGRLARDRWIEQAHYLAAGDRPGFEAAFGRL